MKFHSTRNLMSNSHSIFHTFTPIQSCDRIRISIRYAVYKKIGKNHVRSTHRRLRPHAGGEGGRERGRKIDRFSRSPRCATSCLIHSDALINFQHGVSYLYLYFYFFSHCFHLSFSLFHNPHRYSDTQVCNKTRNKSKQNSPLSTTRDTIHMLN